MKLLRLLAENRAVRGARRFEIVNADTEEATVYLYDMIVSSKLEAEYWGGVAAETFVKDFAAITAPVIHLRINSPGGDVFAARAMEQAIRQHKATVIAHIDGYAASAASFVAIAADQVEIAEGGFFMIHKAWSIAMGNSDDFLSTAALLEQIDGSLVSSYAKRTGMEPDALAAMMAAETWISGPDAVAMKFADRIAPDTVKDQVAWNLSALNAPERAVKPEPAQQGTEAADAARNASHAQRQRLASHLQRIAA